MPAPSGFVRRAWRGFAPNASGLIETAGYIWNTDTLAWEAATASSVSGSVAVSNFPATQAVSGTVTALTATYATRLDEASSTVTYVGKGAAGASNGSAAWQVSRITVSGSVTTIEYADGDLLFDNIWNNRASLSYS